MQLVPIIQPSKHTPANCHISNNNHVNKSEKNEICFEHERMKINNKEIWFLS